MRKHDIYTSQENTRKQSDDCVKWAHEIETHAEPSMTHMKAKKSSRMIVTVHVKFLCEYLIALGRSNDAQAFDGTIGVNEYGTTTGVVQTFELTTGAHKIALKKVECDAKRYERNEHERIDYGRNDQGT